MSDETKDKDLQPEEHSSYQPTSLQDEARKHQLTGMYQTWFLDYASYVILERAVPHLADGLKPVQRRILHAMKRADDGRYNKVAGLVGDTMHFHPHGDQSIGGALVQLGQKYPYGRLGSGSAIHRGAPLEACPRHPFQSENYGVETLLRRACEGACGTTCEVSPALGARRRGHRRWTEC